VLQGLLSLPASRMNAMLTETRLPQDLSSWIFSRIRLIGQVTHTLSDFVHYPATFMRSRHFQHQKKIRRNNTWSQVLSSGDCTIRPFLQHCIGVQAGNFTRRTRSTEAWIASYIQHRLRTGSSIAQHGGIERGSIAVIITCS